MSISTSVHSPTPTPFSEKKILTRYREVSHTFTYGVLATVPLLLIYHLGLPYANEGKRHWIVIGASELLEWIGTLFGLLPHYMGRVSLVGVVAFAIYRERARFGNIFSRPHFLLLTLNEALAFGLGMGLIASGLTDLVLSLIHFPLPETKAAGSGSVLEPLFMSFVKSAGAGFYEEIFFRIVLLGGALWALRLLRVNGSLSRVICLTVTAFLFSGMHYVKTYQDIPHVTEFLYESYLGKENPLFFISFVYRSYMGAFLGAIFLWRGFAVAAWSHAIFDGALYLTLNYNTNAL